MAPRTTLRLRLEARGGTDIRDADVEMCRIAQLLDCTVELSLARGGRGMTLSGFCACGCGAALPVRFGGLRGGSPRQYLSGHDRQERIAVRPRGRKPGSFLDPALCDWRRIGPNLYRCAVCHSQTREPGEVVVTCQELQARRIAG